jgi:FHA domain-containing protein
VLYRALRIKRLFLMCGLLLVLLAAGTASAQSSASVTLLGTPAVENSVVTLKLVVKNPNGLPALNLSQENFTLSEGSQDKQLTSDDSLPIALAVIVDLSHGSDVDLIQAALRAYFSHYYRAGDPVTFYILGPNQNTSTPDVVETPDGQAVNQVIDGLTASARFYSISKALSESLEKLRSIQAPDHPAHVLYVGSFLNDPSEASQSAAFKLAGIPLHVVQAHRYRHPSTPALQKLAANSGGLFADDLGGTSVLNGSTAVNLVKTIYDAIASSRMVYTLQYHTLNQSLEARRSATVTVALSADEQVSADFSYERTFIEPEVKMVSGSLTPVRLPSRSGGQVIFDVARQPVTVSVVYPDGILRKVASLRLEVLDANTGNTLQSNLLPAPEADASGNYVINWALDDFKNPGTTTAVQVKVTVTDELGLSGETTAQGSVTVGALPPLPTSTPAPTATPLPPTAIPPPTAVPTALPASSVAGLLTSSPASVQVLLGVIAALVIVVLLLLIWLVRLRRQRAEEAEELEALREMPPPSPLVTEASAADRQGAVNGKQGDEEKTLFGRLIVIEGLEIPEIPIDQEEFIIGRRLESGSHFVIDKPFVSPRHCAIICREGGFSIRDLNTKNGTFVNGERIPRDREIVVPIGSEVSITERIKLELWDPHTEVNLETRRAGQSDVGTTTRANTSAADTLFQPVPGIRYADDDDSEVEEDYSPL